jgi:hypothetical protein
MKRTIPYNRIIAIILIGMQSAMYLQAVELRFDMGRGGARLEQYLDRASQERSAQKWERLAEAGMQAAMAEWESANLYLRERGEEAWEAGRGTAEAEYKEEREIAYAAWMSARVSEEKAYWEGSALTEELAAARAVWQAGVGAARGEAEIVAAVMGWESEAGAIIDRYISEWEERLCSILSNRLSGVSSFAILAPSRYGLP